MQRVRALSEIQGRFEGFGRLRSLGPCSQNDEGCFWECNSGNEATKESAIANEPGHLPQHRLYREVFDVRTPLFLLPHCVLRTCFAGIEQE